jgi:hypothetical protein
MIAIAPGNDSPFLGVYAPSRCSVAGLVFVYTISAAPWLAIRPADCQGASPCHHLALSFRHMGAALLACLDCEVMLAQISIDQFMYLLLLPACGNGVGNQPVRKRPKAALPEVRNVLGPPFPWAALAADGSLLRPRS